MKLQRKYPPHKRALPFEIKKSLYKRARLAFAYGAKRSDVVEILMKDNPDLKFQDTVRLVDQFFNQYRAELLYLTVKRALLKLEKPDEEMDLKAAKRFLLKVDLAKAELKMAVAYFDSFRDAERELT